MRHAQYNMHGAGYRAHEVYDMPARDPHDYWRSVTSNAEGEPVICPVAGCAQHVVWYEAGYVPGYRVCMAPTAATDSTDPARSRSYDRDSIRHRFVAEGDAERPTLVRDDCCEDDARTTEGA